MEVLKVSVEIGFKQSLLPFSPEPFVFSSAHLVRMIKSWRMRWARPVAYMEAKRKPFWGSASWCACFIKVIRRTVFRNNCLRCLLYLYLDRYMFRPLSAILRRNTQYIKSYYSYNGSVVYCTNRIVYVFGIYWRHLLKRDCEVSNRESNPFFLILKCWNVAVKILKY
jgi:hypothetical protein